MRIQVDASSHCQLACPSCPTASGATRAAMGTGHLNPDAFEAFLDRNPEVTEVELSNYGEMFLNPKLLKILEIAAARQVVLHADNGTNLNHASPEVLEALVRHRFRSLSVSLDGASPETYSKYRVRGDFERVIRNVRILNDFKRKHATGFPLLSWQFIVFGHNEHELPAARAMAAELGMKFRPKISWDDDFSPIRNPELVRIQTGLHATRDAHYKVTGADYTRHICHQLWNAPVLNVDGRLMGCCRNFWGDFGANAFAEGLTEALSAPKLRTAQAALQGRADMDTDAPCATCDLYLTMKSDGHWLTDEEIRRTAGAPGVLTSIVVAPGDSTATHADIFMAPGHEVNRLLLARPPQAHRVKLGVDFSALFSPQPGDYTVYVLPRKLDPEFRRQYPPLPPVTKPVTISARPLVQEFVVPL